MFQKMFENIFERMFELIFVGASGEPDLLTGLIFHVDAMELSSITKDEFDNVSAWNSIFPADINLLQADPSRQPKYEATGYGGSLPTINFLNEGGITDMLLGTSSHATGPMTFVVVTSPTSFDYGGGAMLSAQSSDSDSYDAILTGEPYIADSIYYVEHGGGGGFAGSYTASVNERAILTYAESAIDGKLYHNGQLIGSQIRDLEPKIDLKVFIGPRFLGELSNLYRGKVSEAYIYDRVLTSAERVLLQNQLMTKWGISGDEFLLLEDSSEILLEDNSSILLE